MAIRSILRPHGQFCGCFVYFTVIWYSFSRFGILYQEKSGNPEHEAKRRRAADMKPSPNRFPFSKSG
jgi:hypothetical protein